MKRYIVLALVAVMLLGLCACGNKQEPAQSTTFMAGFGRVKITPDSSVPLAGYGNTTQRMSEGSLNFIYTSCIAVTDANGESILMYTNDHVCTSELTLEDLRSAISEATGVPANRIMISATHTHSGPDVREVITAQHPYYTFFKNAMVEAGTQAMNDRSAAVMYSGSTTVDGLNFVRHYKMSNGKIAGDNFGDKQNATPVESVHKADNEVQILRFVRSAEDKKDIVMMNFQAHPKLASTASTAYGQQNRKLLSSDFVGATTEYVEKTADVWCAYYQGAAGNLNPLDSYIPSNNTAAQKSIYDYGKVLGGAVVEALPTLTETTATPTVKSKQLQFEGQTPNGTVRPMEIDAFCIGDVGFVTVPFEMFDNTGKDIKGASPFETTIVITYANGRSGYLPSQEVWEYGAYELTICYYKQGTAEEVVQQLLSMLNDLKG